MKNSNKNIQKNNNKKNKQNPENSQNRNQQMKPYKDLIFFLYICKEKN